VHPPWVGVLCKGVAVVAVVMVVVLVVVIVITGGVRAGLDKDVGKLCLLTWSYLASLTALRLTAGGIPRQLSTFKKWSFDTSHAAAQQ